MFLEYLLYIVVELRGRLIVVSHGSWNRSPYIGYRVQAYAVDFGVLGERSPTYAVSGQAPLLPPLRHSGTGKRLRPVDVAPSPVDGALLLTADRDDLGSASRYGGGLYRVREAGGAAESGAEDVPLDALNALDANPANVVLERIASIPCARQIALSKANPQLVYVSTYDGFCRASDAGEEIWVVELDAESSTVRRGPVQLVQGLNGPQGIDWAWAQTGSGSLYIATSGRDSRNRGNCVLEIEDVDSLALQALGSTDGSAEWYAMGPQDTVGDTARVKPVVCGYTQAAQGHHWRSLRVHPSGNYGIVSIGANCNWDIYCHDSISTTGGTPDLQTTLLRVELNSATAQKGRVSVAARGIRNAIGLWFDPHGNLLFTSHGSDRASGIAGAASADNVPECTLELLSFEDDLGAGETLAPTAPPSLLCI